MTDATCIAYHEIDLNSIWPSEPIGCHSIWYVTTITLAERKTIWLQQNPFQFFFLITGSHGAIEYGYSIGIHHGDGYSYQTRTGFDTYNSHIHAKS